MNDKKTNYGHQPLSGNDQRGHQPTRPNPNAGHQPTTSITTQPPNIGSGVQPPKNK
jgi:hypothetical protein